MRTTITLDPDVAVLVEREMRARNIRFKEAVNDSLRRQLGGSTEPRPLRIPARDLGSATVDLTSANLIAADLEADETVRDLATGR